MALTVVDGAMLNTANAQYTMFKNRLINGSANIWQRGTSFSVTTVGLPTTDRWVFENANGNTMSVTQQSNSSQLYGSGLYYIQATVPSILSGTSGQYFIQMYQTIEAINIADCAGGNVTLSFTASVSSSSGSPQIWIYAGYPSAMDNWTSASYPQVGTLTPSATPTRYTVTIPLSSAYRNGLRLYIGVRSSVATAINSVNFSIGEIQLEKGSNATVFDYRPIGTELALCQRYYWQQGPYTTGVADGLNYVFCLGSVWANAWHAYTPFPVTMRVAPTFTSSAINTFQYHVAGVANAALTSMAVSYSTVNGARLGGATTYASTGGLSAQIACSNNSTTYLAFSAEF